MLASAVCTICTDNYDAEKAVAAMPCGHVFHDECLAKWLSNARNCPSCRKTLKKNQHPIHRVGAETGVSCSAMLFWNDEILAILALIGLHWHNATSVYNEA